MTTASNFSVLENRCTTSVCAKLYLRLKQNKNKFTAPELKIYDQLVIYYLFEEYRERMTGSVSDGKKIPDFDFYRQFKIDFEYYFKLLQIKLQPQFTPVRVFEIYYQVHRAFFYIFDFIIGSSKTIAQLRASIWQSIFTHDIYRYERSLFDGMQNITTLIKGPS